MSIQTAFAHFTAKSALHLMRLAGRRGSQLTGAIALHLDPHFVESIKKPERILSITGTNGKTTTSNLIGDMLKQLGHTYIHNNNGSNTKRGIASSFANQEPLFGPGPSYAVLEQDELWFRRFREAYTPRTLTVTNLYQDSIDRNANIQYIFQRINEGIHEETTLILNASDSISAYLGTDANRRVYFNVQPLEGEVPCTDSKIQDMIYCPQCGRPIVWDFKRYHHIGRYHCDHCGFTNPPADYEAYARNIALGTLQLRDHGQEVVLPLIQSAVENIYNEVAAYATLRENGFSIHEVLGALSQIQITASRYEESTMGEKRIISVVSKGNNPVATSRIFYNIKNTEGPRTVIYLTDDERPDLNHTCPGWIFMSDFAYLKDVDQVIFMTKYAGNAQFTAVLDGVPPERIHIADHLEQIPDQIDPQRRETIFILHDIEDYTQNMARELIAQLRRRIGGNQ